MMVYTGSKGFPDALWENHEPNLKPMFGLFKSPQFLSFPVEG